MKKAAVLLISILFLFSSCASKDLVEQPVVAQLENHTDLKTILSIYADFLNGETKGVTQDGEISIADIFQHESDDSKSLRKYALFDMNGDEIPELHVRSVYCYMIFTVYDQQLILWNMFPSTCWPTNNKAILNTRIGAAPSHLTYYYQMFDFYGNSIIGITFEKYDVDENGVYDVNDWYLIDGVEVPKESWDALTPKYLSEPIDKIEWLNHSEKINIS